MNGRRGDDSPTSNCMSSPAWPRPQPAYPAAQALTGSPWPDRIHGPDQIHSLDQDTAIQLARRRWPLRWRTTSPSTPLRLDPQAPAKTAARPHALKQRPTSSCVMLPRKHLPCPPSSTGWAPPAPQASATATAGDAYRRGTLERSVGMASGAAREGSDP